MADKPGTERKIWVLPTELMDRIRAYQTDQSIASEVETARRLLFLALSRTETTDQILARLRQSFAECRDVRMAAQNVLATHPRVTEIRFGGGGVEFLVEGSDISVRMEASDAR